MKTIITQRNFKPLYHFLIILSIFLLTRLYFVFQFKSLGRRTVAIMELDQLAHDSKYTHDMYGSLYKEISVVEGQYGWVIVIFALLVFYNLSKYFKTIKHKFILFLIELSLVFLVFSMTTSELRLNAHEDDKYFISLLIFLPFLYFIYHNSLIGKTVDISTKIKGKTEQLHNEDLNDLENLFKLNLISKEEYNKKKDFRIKDKIRVELEDSEEYNLLVKSKLKGLLTEEEFKIKFENLVNNEYKKTL